jgi:hypothetical protein
MFETQGSTKTGTGLPDLRRPFLEATMGFEPMIGVLQNLTQATFGTLARLWPDPV